MKWRNGTTRKMRDIVIRRAHLQAAITEPIYVDLLPVNEVHLHFVWALHSLLFTIVHAQTLRGASFVFVAVAQAHLD